MSEGRNTVTIQDADFCAECGSILPLPGDNDNLKCMQCDFTVDIRGTKYKIPELELYKSCKCFIS